MAEARKKVKEKKEIKKNNSSEEKVQKNKKKVVKNNDKKNLFVRFRIFCHGVVSEFHKVVWPSKKDMIKYSIATIVFIIACAGYFYLIDLLFAFVRSLFS